VLLLGLAIASLWFLGALSVTFAIAAGAVLTVGFNRFWPIGVAVILGTGIAAAGFFGGVAAIFG
jgi:hypothetical protein